MNNSNQVKHSQENLGPFLRFFCTRFLYLHTIAVASFWKGICLFSLCHLTLMNGAHPEDFSSLIP